MIRDIVDIDFADDIDSIKGKGAALSGIIGLSAECKKEAKILVDKAKVASLLHHSKAGTKMSPLLMGKLVDAECAEENGLYVYADRLNAAVTHQLEHTRTLISLYKQELSTETQAGHYTT